MTSTPETPDPAQGMSINEAARRTGKSAKTIQRHLDTLQANGATKDDAGLWQITEESLVASGFPLVDPADMTEATTEARSFPVPASVHAETVAERDELRTRLAVAESERVAAGERLADRDRELAQRLADRDRELATKDATLAAKDEALASKDQALDALRVTVSALRALESGHQTSAIEATSTPTQPPQSNHPQASTGARWGATDGQPEQPTQEAPRRRWWQRQGR